MRHGLLIGLLWTAACARATACGRPSTEPARTESHPAPAILRTEPPPGPPPVPTRPVQTPRERALIAAGLVHVTPGPGLRVSLLYATDENFTGKRLYVDFSGCWLRPEAAAKLETARLELVSRRPELALVLADCTRPVSVQRELWRSHPNPAHVADPGRVTSAHNHGCAVDLTLGTADGELEMGTGIDEFAAGTRLTVRHEAKLCTAGDLSPAACANRRLLREIMVHAGFVPYDGEWWHFSGCDKDRFPAVN